MGTTRVRETLGPLHVDEFEEADAGTESTFMNRRGQGGTQCPVSNCRESSVHNEQGHCTHAGCMHGTLFIIRPFLQARMGIVAVEMDVRPYGTRKMPGSIHCQTFL